MSSDCLRRNRDAQGRHRLSTPSTTLEEVVRIMADTNVQVLVVTGPDEEALGTISQMDVLQFYGQELKGIRAREVMRPKVPASRRKCRSQRPSAL